jgi:hypothetical protein
MCPEKWCQNKIRVFEHKNIAVFRLYYVVSHGYFTVPGGNFGVSYQYYTIREKINLKHARGSNQIHQQKATNPELPTIKLNTVAAATRVTYDSSYSDHISSKSIIKIVKSSENYTKELISRGAYIIHPGLISNSMSLISLHVSHQINPTINFTTYI